MDAKDVLVKVHACGLCYHDVLVMQGVLRRGVKERVVLGHEISGTVAQVGDSVEGFKVGDPVASIFTEPCGYCDQCRRGMEQRCANGRGIGHRIDGGLAEFVKLHENALVTLSEGTDLDGASLYSCPIGVAYNAIKDVAGLQAGERALVTGAGGGLGVHSIQIAKAIGASVFAVTTSPEKMDRLSEVGADEVLLVDDLDFSELGDGYERRRGRERSGGERGRSDFQQLLQESGAVWQDGHCGGHRARSVGAEPG